jgi:hypothetical protein
MRLIAFTGGYGCGKSTAIEALEPWTQGREVLLIKFAEELYAIQEFIYGRISRVHQRPTNFVKDRRLLQWLGTEWGRGVDESLWVKIWQDKVTAAYERNPHVVIVCDDCRFENEAIAVKQMQGTIIRLQRSDNGAYAQGGTGIVNHASETGFSNEYVDYLIENNSTLEDFKESLSTLFGEQGIGGEQTAQRLRAAQN